MIIGIDKPSGVSTHASSKDPDHEGSVEYFSRVRSQGTWPESQKLFVCHRLDKGTSGALLFATSSEDAAALGAQFEAHEIKKTYLFVTDEPRSRRPDKFSVSSHIEKKNGYFVSGGAEPARAANAHTDFEFVHEDEGYTLWRAFPRTGKPHQIRLHAEASGLSILGDVEHGGSSFPGLMLLSESITYRVGADVHTHSVPRSRLMDQLNLCRNARVAGWILAIERRERWRRSWQAVSPSFALGETCRLLHTDGGSLRADLLGGTVALQWFTDDPVINKSDQDDIDALIRLMNWKQWHLQLRTDRGRAPKPVAGARVGPAAEVESTSHQSRPAPPVRWVATEHDLKFEFRLDSSLSTGLFLDQRANRRWLRRHASGKSVLNLFSYTGGFSIAAAVGDASLIVSVDLSKNFIEWSKRNFEINGLGVDRHEFRAFDSREFLKIAAKKRRTFDVIICDPPSFSRSENGVFRIEKDLPHLLTALREVLAPGGTILFATNFESWSVEHFRALLEEQAPRLRLRFESVPPGDWDFEANVYEPIMKSALLHDS